MALYGKLDVDIEVALDSDYKNLLFKMTDDTLNTVIRTDLTVHSAGVAQVAASPGTFTVPMGDVLTGNLVVIKSDKEIRVTLNGGAEYVTVKPSGSYKGCLVLHGEITAVSVANQATAAAQVEYCIVGAES
jgi:hypothetical protein